MNFVTLICVLSQFLTIVLSTENVKTVPLCMEKRPKNIRKDWKPNHDEMRELMLKAAILNEEILANGGERYYPGRDNRRRISRRPSRPKSPSASERSHVGTKSPVLGSSDLVTDTKHDAGFLSTVYEAYR